MKITKKHLQKVITDELSGMLKGDKEKVAERQLHRIIKEETEKSILEGSDIEGIPLKTLQNIYKRCKKALKGGKGCEHFAEEIKRRLTKKQKTKRS
jgi:hypothetical protein